jgi:hypothetical protein
MINEMKNAIAPEGKNFSFGGCAGFTINSGCADVFITMFGLGGQSYQRSNV